jgi:AcrR family transcriptional regulator
MLQPTLYPQTRALQTQDRILAAARSLLAQGGAPACAMRAVAERAGVTPGAIYRHFSDKDALVARVVELAFQHFETFLLESIVSLPVGSFARIAALGEAYIRFAQENEEEFKIIFTPQVTERKKVDEIPGRAGYPILRRCIAEAMAAEAVRQADPDLVAFYLWSRVHGIVMLLLACDLDDALDVAGGASALNLFEATRTFVTDGLKRTDAR